MRIAVSASVAYIILIYIPTLIVHLISIEFHEPNTHTIWQRVFLIAVEAFGWLILTKRALKLIWNWLKNYLELFIARLAAIL